MTNYILAARLDCAFCIGCPQAQWKFDSPDDPVSMLEVLLELRESDLRELPVVEPKRPDAVDR
jgi:hypothetical protein